MTSLAYNVRDRSILLPAYKKLIVEPTLRFIPRRLDPNVITHGGQVICLAGLVVLVAFGSRAGGWAFFFCTVMAHVYLWCDNADGGHARRTNQCSALGEFLDHGLDLLNATYCAAMAAVAMGMSPLWTASTVMLVTAAAAAIYWEQAETGTFHLAPLNQIESVFALTGVLVVGGIFGTDVFTYKVGPFEVRMLLQVFLLVNATYSALIPFYRVMRSKGALMPYAPLAAFGVVVLGCGAVGALTPLASLVVGVSGYVFLGLRHLTQRLRGSRPLTETALVLMTIAFAVLGGYRLAGGVVLPTVGWVAAGGAILFFGVYSALNFRDGHRLVANLDGEKRAAREAVAVDAQ